MYTTEQNDLILKLIKDKRRNIQDDRQSLSKAKYLTNHEVYRIEQEIAELRDLETTNRIMRLRG